MKKDFNHVNLMLFSGEAEVFSSLHSDNASPGYYWDSSSETERNLSITQSLGALCGWDGVAEAAEK